MVGEQAPSSTLLNTYLGGEAAIANGALEGTLLGVAAIVNLQCRVARERLEADITSGVATQS